MSPRDFALLPRDGFFCKDGRGWTSAGGAGRTTGLDWPFPTTLRGALRTAYGLDKLESGEPWPISEWDKATNGIRLVATLPLLRPWGVPWDAKHRLWPVPADVLYLRDRKRTAGRENADHTEDDVEALRLDPRPWSRGCGSIGIQGDSELEDRARERLWWARVDEAGKPARPPRFWTDAQFAAWLALAPLPAAGKGVTTKTVQPASRRQVHLAVKPETGAAEDAALFSTTVTEALAHREQGLALREWAIALSVEAPPEWTPTHVALGSDRRIATLDVLPPRLLCEPSESLVKAWSASSSRGVRLVLVTPGEFEQGWLPPFLAPGSTGASSDFVGDLPGCGEVVLRSAMVGRPLHVSGWDVARGKPKGTRRLVPAGSVYFLERTSHAPFSWDDVRGLWMTQFGKGAEDGLGLLVPGRWNPAESQA
ncbi:MAG: hypothetical protein NDI82_00025 [Anaeromyxobacteraceae bacterium]|nr:hypothetical protein [Anaeromyxobacteraceae bacterium]